MGPCKLSRHFPAGCGFVRLSFFPLFFSEGNVFFPTETTIDTLFFVLFTTSFVTLPNHHSGPPHLCDQPPTLSVTMGRQGTPLTDSPSRYVPPKHPTKPIWLTLPGGTGVFESPQGTCLSTPLPLPFPCGSQLKMALQGCMVNCRSDIYLCASYSFFFYLLP